MLDLTPNPSPKDHWFTTFVGMVKGGKGNQFGEGEEYERGLGRNRKKILSSRSRIKYGTSFTGMTEE